MGGFFYFKDNKAEPLTYENNNAEKVLEAEIEKDDDIEVSAPEKPAETVTDDNVLIDSSTEEKITNKASNEDSSDDLKVEEQKKTEEINLEIKNHLVSWGFSGSEGRKIDTIILHSSYNVLGGDEYDFDKIIQEYKDYGVAPHYVIDREGKIFRLVKDSNIAYHAGESSVPDGRTGVNSFSIGIELINTEKDKFTSSQYDSANDLIEYLKDKYKIKYILGHDQIAPERKTDPWNIDWGKISK